MKLYIAVDLPDVKGLTEQVATSLNIKFEDLDGNPIDLGRKEWSVYDHLSGYLYNSLTDETLDRQRFTFD